MNSDRHHEKLPPPKLYPDGLLTPEQKLIAIKTRAFEVLKNRMSVLTHEASTISSDLDALALRLMSNGSEAIIEDIISARWYQTKAEYLMACDWYSFICQLLGEDEQVVLPEDVEMALDHQQDE